MFRNRFLFAALLLALAPPSAWCQTENETSTNDTIRAGYRGQTTAFAFAHVNAPIAGCRCGRNLGIRWGTAQWKCYCSVAVYRQANWKIIVGP
jgi:hypothetical protein